MSENTENITQNLEKNINDTEEKPTCIIVLGMAGSGKTTFVQVSYYLYLFYIVIK